MSKYYRSAIERVIRTEASSSPYSFNPQERDSYFAVALTHRAILPSELLHRNLFFVPCTFMSMGHLSLSRTNIQRNYATQDSCPQNGQPCCFAHMELGNKRNCWLAECHLLLKLEKGILWRFLEESTVDLFMYFIIMCKLIINHELQ